MLSSGSVNAPPSRYDSRHKITGSEHEGTSRPMAEEATKRPRVVSFGEGMIRLTPPRNERLERTISLDLSPGGAELNTAVTLACLGIEAEWVSRLPDNGAGRYLARQSRAHGVDLSHVNWVSEDEGRMGLYFLEEGTDPRPSVGALRPAELRLCSPQTGRIRLGRHLGGCQRVPHLRHHPGGQRSGARGIDDCDTGREQRQRSGLFRSQLSLQALDRGRGAALLHGNRAVRRCHVCLAKRTANLLSGSRATMKRPWPLRSTSLVSRSA